MSGNLSRSMRENYDTHGVDEYYKIVGSSYLRWWQHERQPSEKGVLVCDLACGSGEVTVALQEWWAACQNQNQLALSVPNPTIPRPPVPRPVVSPLRPAAPPAPVTRPAISRPQAPTFPRISPTEPPLRIVATDPYTSDAYRARTGLPCIAMSFHDVAVEGLPDSSTVLVVGEDEAGDEDESTTGDEKIESGADSHPEDREPYDLVVCSFALHLLTTPGSLYELLSALSYGARWLVVLEPHKKPEIKEGWGWTLWDMTAWQETQGREGEFVKERVHCRVYKSTNL
ncbi:unnamed protein product [Rhizoctonia solani]|uniref:Methyltransferase domain-containing protein n=1 Tax=Rhizoctonia solani TaxID=456999 RepID=A0A8H3GP11_9AGAM|nr:unnamed protein product [Rhizoctonia solani]